MEYPDWLQLECPWATDEPIAVGTFDIDVENPDEPLVMGIVKMALVHERNTKTLSSSFQHELTRIEMVDRRGLQPGEAHRLLPGIEAVG